MVNQWLNIAHNWLSPATCLLCGGCGVGGRDLCMACLDDMPSQAVACCHCATPLTQAGVCGSCQQCLPAYHKVIAPFIYRYPLNQLIPALKFSSQLHIARLLGTLMVAEVLRSETDLPELLLPVPLHPCRLRQRGYNQALELAWPIAQQLGIAVDYRSCQRRRDTEPQSGLAADARKRNLRDAFDLVRPLSVGHVAIIDDVMTTGCTVDALSQRLLLAGVSRVDVWVCARAPAPGD